jgi:hypothetical protein
MHMLAHACPIGEAQPLHQGSEQQWPVLRYILCDRSSFVAEQMHFVADNALSPNVGPLREAVAFLRGTPHSEDLMLELHNWPFEDTNGSTAWTNAALCSR